MESDLQRHNHHPHLPQHHQKQMNSGLTRYQSAPSAYFSSFMDREFFEEFLNRPTSPETERIFARFLSGSGGNMDNPSDQKFGNFRQRSPVKQTSRQMEQQPQILTSTSKETGVMLRQQQLQQSSYSSASRSFYQSQSQQHLSRQNSGSAMDYRATSTMGMDQPPHLKMVGGSSTSSNLIRHSSSPAGFFSVLDGEDGYALLRGMGSFGGGNSTDRESSFASASRQHSCSSGLMSPITEIESQKANSSESGGLGYPIGCSWDDSAFMSDDISGSTGVRDDDRGLSKNIEAANRPPSGQKLRLPGKSPADISAIEKFFQDSVPCKIRAKRGFATHPRSIAERVRRTRISERMRKLQDLVPNMDKQTNTADMLDLAVEYIKDLQQQVKALSDNREKCICPNKQEE